MISKQVIEMKAKVSRFPQPAKAAYQMGIRDGMDLLMRISDDKWPFAKDKNFQEFHDFLAWLDQQ